MEAELGHPLASPSFPLHYVEREGPSSHRDLIRDEYRERRTSLDYDRKVSRNKTTKRPHLHLASRAVPADEAKSA